MIRGIKMVFVAGLMVFMASCGSTRKLSKTYTGKPVSVLKETFGDPGIVLDRENEKVYIFEKVKRLKSTEINQAKLTLDPMVTPRVEKTERYYFTVKDSIITDVRYEEEYER